MVNAATIDKDKLCFFSQGPANLQNPAGKESLRESGNNFAILACAEVGTEGVSTKNGLRLLTKAYYRHLIVSALDVEFGGESRRRCKSRLRDFVSRGFVLL